MNFASKLSFLWLVHPLCSLGYRFVPSTGRHSSLPPSPSGREENLWGVGGLVPPQKTPPNPRNSRPNTTRQASPPHEMRPNGRISGGRGGTGPPTKKAKGHGGTGPPTKKLPQTHETAGQTRHAKPHHLMKCARMGAFRGAWGDWSPHKKNPPIHQRKGG